MAQKFSIEFKEDFFINTKFGEFKIPKEFMNNINVRTAVDGHDYIEGFLGETSINLEVSKEEAERIWRIMGESIIFS